MIKAVIFDVGGVLIRTEDREPRAELETSLGLAPGEADELYFNGPAGRQAQLGQITTAELLESIQVKLGLDAAGIAAFWRAFWAGDCLDEALVGYIRSLRPQYQTAIISNWADNLLTMISMEYPMVDAFDLVVGSATEGVMKPDATIFARTIERLGIAPYEAVFIDDFAHNVAGARAAGLQAVHFQPGVDLPAALAELGVFVPGFLEERFALRPAAKEDILAVVELLNAHSLTLKGEKSVMVAEMETEYATKGFEPRRDTFLFVERHSGRFAAYGECWNESPPHVETYFFAKVHPEFQELGLGSRLIQLAESRAREKMPLAPAEARVVVLVAADIIDTGALSLFADQGYSQVRTYHRMLIELAELPPEPALPAGLNVRTFQPDDLEKLVHAYQESFSDHWGATDSPIEDELARWRTYLEDATFDPNAWLIAWDGEEIAGFSVCWPTMAESPDMGLVNNLGVRRPWRRRGLGLALLRQSFRALYKLGKRKIRLGVDSTSLTNATALYERAGMQIITSTGLYEKELRPGIELRTNEVDA